MVGIFFNVVELVHNEFTIAWNALIARVTTQLCSACTLAPSITHVALTARVARPQEFDSEREEVRNRQQEEYNILKIQLEN